MDSLNRLPRELHRGLKKKIINYNILIERICYALITDPCSTINSEDFLFNFLNIVLLTSLYNPLQNL